MSLEDLFPNLNAENHHITSECTEDYNCIAWAAGYNDAWWDPNPFPEYYWPEGLPLRENVETLCNLFESLGYARCDGAELEEGYEKVAIYGFDNNEYTHAARQLANGQWTSKIGGFEDIQHSSLEALCGSDYGEVKAVLKRPRT